MNSEFGLCISVFASVLDGPSKSVLTSQKEMPI